MKHALIFLLCSGGWSLTVGTKAVTLADEDARIVMPRSTKDDCAGRKTDCYQAGAFMVNLMPKNRQGVVYVWINTDTDDIPDNRGLGERVACREQ